MPKVLSFDRNMTEVQIKSGRVAQQSKDGTFTVSESEAKFLKKSGAFTLVGMGLAATKTVVGFRCNACGFLAAFKDHCGRCGATELTPEE